MKTLDFQLTKEEAEVATARLAWRMALADGLTLRHFAPLAAFALAVLFVAILGFTGLVGRRAAEVALIVSAAAYMLYRLWMRRRFLYARREAEAFTATLRDAPARLTLDETGLRLAAGGAERAANFADGFQADAVSGLVYVWPRLGPPLVWPERADADGALLLAARRNAPPPPPSAPDDDDD